MTAADVLRAIRARWLLFAVCCIVPLAAAVRVARTSAPVYTATAELFVAPASPATGTNTYQNAFSAAQLAAQQAPSYASLVDSPAVMRAVIADLHLAMTPSQLCRPSLRHLAAEQRPHRHHGAWRFSRCGDGYRQRHSWRLTALAERVAVRCRPGVTERCARRSR